MQIQTPEPHAQICLFSGLPETKRASSAPAALQTSPRSAPRTPRRDRDGKFSSASTEEVTNAKQQVKEKTTGRSTEMLISVWVMDVTIALPSSVIHTKSSSTAKEKQAQKFSPYCVFTPVKHREQAPRRGNRNGCSEYADFKAKCK